VVLLTESKFETTEPSGCRLFNFKKVDNIDKDNLLQYIIPKDIKDFGLIPEIIGRLPVLTHMDPLEKP
jgi:ATP-dependent protease Clp ATPase subunit